MPAFTRILALSALLSAAVAVPMKRELIINTVTEVEVVTQVLTATVWVDAPDAAPTYHAAHHTHGSDEHHTSAVVTSQVQSTSSTSVYVAPPRPTTTTTPASTSTTTSSSSTSSSTSTSTSTTQAPQVYTAPAQPAIPVLPATSVYVEPPAPTTSSSSVAVVPVYTPPPPPPAVTTTSPAAAATSTTSSSSSGAKTYTGQITYYDVGLGSCGITNTNTDMVVAMSAAMMDKATMCGKTITINYNGKSHQATVVDTCPSCAAGSLDLSPSLFQVFSDFDAGRVSGATWSFN